MTNPLSACRWKFLNTPEVTRIFDLLAMTHKWLCVQIACFFLVAIVIPRHSFKIATTRFARFTSCLSAGTSNAYVNFDPRYAPANAPSSNLSTDTEIINKSRIELISSFLVSEGDYLGSFEWKITEICHTVFKTSYKCTQIERPGKSVFLKHFHTPPLDGKDFDRLRYEFEGGSIRSHVNVTTCAQ